MSAPVTSHTAPSRKRTPSRSHLIGLDGLRAVAVAAVVVYHLGTGHVTGGFLGVDLFFVLSGFLITTLLFGEVLKSGRINFGQFYLRRARRLLPALFLMLSLTALLVATVARDVASQFVQFVPGALVYASNWWAIHAHQSYFQLIGRGNPLAHLWSLAIEEQFYLVWPAVVGGLWALARRRNWRLRKVVFFAAIGGALVSTALMTWQSLTHGFPLDADPTRVYFGTDTHAMSVLIGAALAAIWRPLSMQSKVVRSAQVTIGVVGVVGLVATGWLFINVSEYTPWLYRGGFLVAALVFALLIAAASHPASPVGRVLEWSPIRWVGQRSYGIYLYHWPIFLVTRPGTDIPWTGAWVQALRIALVLGVSELSYRFVEVPIRKGALGRLLKSFTLQVRHVGIATVMRTHSRTSLVTGAMALAFIAVVTVGLSSGMAADARAEAAMLTQSKPIDGVVVPKGNGATNPAKTHIGTTTAYTHDGSKPGTPTSPRAVNLTGYSVSWFGDSVSLWSVNALARQMPGIRVDAGLNRSPGFIEGRVLSAKSLGTLRTVVVMHLGDAGPVSPSQLDYTLRQLKTRTRVVLVNSTARFSWVPSSNVTLKKAAAKYPNVVLADWHSFSHGHASWFKDGLHLSEYGKPIFAKYVAGYALGSAK